MFGIPRAAVLAVAAGTDLLCLGRDGSEGDYLAVREALVAAVRDGTLDGARLEEAADRVARLRGGLARTRLPGAVPDGGASVVADRARIGLAAAQRAVRASGPRRALLDPAIIEVEPRENIAAGRFGWGLGPWAPAGSVRRVSVADRRPDGAVPDGAMPGSAVPDGAMPGSAVPDGAVSDGTAGILAAAAGILEVAAGRSLVAVVRDAHRDQNTRSLVNALLASRPDLILVEMGLPLWRPPEGVSYLATYGASRASAHAAAEWLGLV
jgi:beta-N-acetylhexosaminidase